MRLDKNIGSSTIYKIMDYKETNFSIFGPNAHWKQSSISLFPNCPKEPQKKCFLHLFSFPPNKNPRQPNRISLTEEENNQDTSKGEKNSCQKNPVLRHAPGCDQSTPFGWQKKHMLVSIYHLLWSWSNVRTFPQSLLPSKKTYLKWNPWIPNNTY